MLLSDRWTFQCSDTIRNFWNWRTTTRRRLRGVEDEILRCLHVSILQHEKDGTQGGDTIDPRNFNFTFTFIAGKENTFTCSHTIGAANEWVNCVYDEENNAVLCLLDNHGMLPGLLKRELTIEEPLFCNR